MVILHKLFLKGFRLVANFVFALDYVGFLVNLLISAVGLILFFFSIVSICWSCHRFTIICMQLVLNSSTTMNCTTIGLLYRYMWLEKSRTLIFSTYRLQQHNYARLKHQVLHRMLFFNCSCFMYYWLLSHNQLACVKALRETDHTFRIKCKSDSCSFEAILVHHGFFFLSETFKHTALNSTSLLGYRTRCPTDLQHLCSKVLINK